MATREELRDAARAAVNAFVWADAETDETDTNKMIEFAVNEIEDWCAAADRDEAVRAALLRVAEAARDVIGDYADHEGPQTPAFALLRAALADLERVQL